MKYTISDIEIFITTYNRADYLAQSIVSILNQTAKVKEITILDNNSQDNTEQVVRTFSDRGVKYIKTHGFLGNFNYAQSFACKKYVMLFHDDDLLHPYYLEYALKLINIYPNISLVTSRYTEFFDDAPACFNPKISKEHYYFTKQQDIARHLYFVEKVAYATAIYRTSDFKNTKLDYEQFSKFNDWPFMVKISSFGGSVLLNDSQLFYVRRHPNQDTWTQTNTPTLQQIVNWDLFFFNSTKCWLDKLMIKYHLHLFMRGKFINFLSSDDKKIYSIDDLWKTAEKAGITPYKKDRLPFLIRKIRKHIYLSFVYKKGKRDDF